MIKSLKVDNFKSLVDFKIDFHENNVIVGNNATGKSTILQAIDFLCCSVKEDFNIILERRGWQIDNVKSKLTASKHNKITFVSEFQLDVNGIRKDYVWELVISTIKTKNEMMLSSEKVTVENEELLNYVYNKTGYFLTKHKTEAQLPEGMALYSSVMKMLRASDNIAPELRTLVQFVEKVSSFELLSPSEMRLSSRGNKDTIGMSGKNLPSFIKRMNEEQKSSFMLKLQGLLGEKIETVNAETKGKPGWTQINTIENYKMNQITVTSKEMSDGMLRLLAFIAISELQSREAVILLDEVENGINLDYAEKLMKVMQALYAEKQHQLIMTTHSSVFLDYIAAEDIIFLYRDENGFTKAVHLFEEEYFKEKLEYMWPGEVLLNMSQTEVVEKILSMQGGV